jgi:hypothetical protein
VARETKQDRIVRNMFDQTSEHLHELKELATNPATKESDVERWCHSLLKSCLGFSVTNGYSIRSQESRGKLRPDLVIYKDEKPICVAEVKKLGFDLSKSDFRSGKVQLSEYLHSIEGVEWGFLCNGYEWKLFDFSDKTNGFQILAIDLRNDVEELDLTKRGVEDSCWELVDIHESTFSTGAWHEFSKEANAFSPESLARAILSADVVRHIARAIRGEHEFKANADVLVDKIRDLLEMGLDDSITGWDEMRQAELQKYIKSQKKAGRKRKRANAKSAEVSVDAIVPPIDKEALEIASAPEGEQIVGALKKAI